MHDILKNYYNIDISIDEPGYFHYLGSLYYIEHVKNFQQFLTIYQLYRYTMHSLHIQAYKIVPNVHQNMISQSYVLCVYQSSAVDFYQYLHIILQPVRISPIPIKNIKEQWIEKIDCCRECAKNYAYSFKHDQDILSLIYYYCGVGENSVNILNHILSLQQDATIPLSLALNHPIQNYMYELLNPFYYTISSRSREIIHLLQSQLIDLSQIKMILESEYFDIFEMIYLFARTLYPSTFFQQLLSSQLDNQSVQKYYSLLEQEKLLYSKMRDLLSIYVTLPKINWINEENMV